MSEQWANEHGASPIEETNDGGTGDSYCPDGCPRGQTCVEGEGCLEDCTQDSQCGSGCCAPTERGGGVCAASTYCDGGGDGGSSGGDSGGSGGGSSGGGSGGGTSGGGSGDGDEECDWKTDCVTASASYVTGCNGDDTLQVTYTNQCSEEVWLRECFEEASGSWSCGATSLDVGNSNDTQPCLATDPTGNYKYWAGDISCDFPDP